MEVVKRKRGRPRGSGKKPQPDQQQSDEGQEADKHRIRPRHELWDLEAQVEQHQATIAQLEAANKALQRRLEMLNASVRVREDQVERFRMFGDQPTAPAPARPEPEMVWLSVMAASTSVSSASSLKPQNCSGKESPGPAGSNLTTGYDRQSNVDSSCGPGSAPVQCKTMCLVKQGSQLASSFAGSARDLSLQTIIRGLPQPHFQFNQDDIAHGSYVNQEVHWDSNVQGAGACTRDTMSDCARSSQRMHLCMSASVKEVIELCSTNCTRLSKLLYAAEDSGPQAAAAQDDMRDYVQLILRPLGGIIKVCNPAVIACASQPLNEGQGPPPAQHWEGVAAAILFTPQQIEDVCTLHELQLEWRTRIEKEQAHASSMLKETVKEAEQHLQVHWAEGHVRNTEMMRKMQRVSSSHHWLAILVDEVLLTALLTPIQVARVIVHSYPWIPDAVALVQAVARQAGVKAA